MWYYNTTDVRQWLINIHYKMSLVVVIKLIKNCISDRIFFTENPQKLNM